MPGLSPRTAAASASLRRKFIQYEKENTGRDGGMGAFSLGCFLPARTREIPGARDAEQWAEELAHTSPDGELKPSCLARCPGTQSSCGPGWRGHGSQSETQAA